MNAFFHTAAMAFRETGYYGVVNTVGNYLLRYLRLLALCVLWRTLFAGGVDGDGLTLSQTLSYTLLSAAFAPLLDPRTQMPSLLYQGKMLSFYLRPAGIFTQMMARTAGELMMYGAVFTLPCLLVLAPLLSISARPASWLALPSLLLCVSQGFAVDYLFGCLVIRMKNLYWQAEGIRSSLSLLLTGALIPFSLLPEGLAWLAYSPLGTLAGAPLAIATGLGDPTRLIAAQLIWNVVLWPLAAFMFAKSRERMVSYGG